jgi:hypothetical protein
MGKTPETGRMTRRVEALGDRDNAPADAAKWIAVLPLGATEQHGPHLPFETDSLIAEALVERLIDRLPDSAPVVFLPVESVGYSPEHMFGRAQRRLAGTRRCGAGCGSENRRTGRESGNSSC